MTIRVRLFGVYSTAVIAPSLILRMYFGSTVMLASGTLTTVSGVTNDGWSAEGLFIVQTLGASGTVEAQGLSEFSTAATAVLFVNMDNVAPITINTTLSQTIQSSIQWGGTVSAGDTITLREMTVEIMAATGISAPPPPPPFAVIFGEDGEDGLPGPPGGPGIRGASGANGVAGSAGPAIFMIGDDGQDGDIGPPGVVGATGASGGGGGSTVFNVTPDTHLAVPTGVGLGPNDEFETGTSIDTAGTRYGGATPWTAFSAGPTNAVNNGSVIVLPQLNSGINVSGYSQPVPAGSWQYTAKITAFGTSGSAGLGIFVAASTGAAGNISMFSINSVASVVQNFSNATTFSGTVGAASNTVTGQSGSGPSQASPVYYRINFDGTTLTYLMSASGIEGTYFLVAAQTAAAFIVTPALVGIGGFLQSASLQGIVISDWFRRTA